MSRVITKKELQKWQSIQQRTPEWYCQRKKLLTASEIPAVLELSPYISKYDLFQKKLEGLLSDVVPDEISNEAMEWGQIHEPLAKEYYGSMPLANGPRVVHEVGLIKHPTYSFIGASPDGLVQTIKKTNDWWLLEIKCPFKRDFHDQEKTIPLYIWVQIQIQLEVCDLPFCHLLQCKYDQRSKLERRKLSTIKRDTKWFNTIALPEIRDFWDLLKRATIYQHVTKPYPDPKEWVSMNSFTGKLLSDPILDWLNEYKDHPKIKEFECNTNLDRLTLDRMKDKDNLYRAIEENLVRFCREKDYDFITITPLEERSRESLSVRRFNQTKSALKAKKGVIFRPVLLNYGQKIHGIPDILMRNDVALDFLKTSYPETTTDIGFIETSINEFKEVGYVIVSLTLRASFKRRPIVEGQNEVNEVNEVKVEASDDEFVSSYKVGNRVSSFSLPPPAGLRRSSRLMAVERLSYEEVTSDDDEVISDTEELPESTVFFQKWDKVLRTRYAGYSDIVDTLLSDKGPCTLVAFLGSWFCHVANPALIDYVKQDVMDGANWIRVVKKEGQGWADDLDENYQIPSDYRLMPNMCNKYDQRWRKAKLILAERWGEHTLLWYCGVKQRERAHSKGIYSWRSCLSTKKVVNSYFMDEKDNFRRRIMRSMIRLNRSDDKVYHSYRNKKFQEPYLDIPEKTQEFFVDFEVIPYCGKNTQSVRLQQPNGMIYLIGMGWIEKDEWVFRSFVASSLTNQSEKKILLEWWKTIHDVKKRTKVSKAVLYHWSGAEPRFLMNALKRNPISRISDDIEYGRYEFRDMMEMFIEAEVVVRGVWGYSIKDVAKGLYKHGLIQEIWEIGEKGNQIECGEGTLTTASGCYRNALKHGISVSQVPQFSSLREYNKMDCRVMYDLLLFLREHIYAPRKGMVSPISSPVITKTSSEIWGDLPEFDLDKEISQLGKRKHTDKKDQPRKRRKRCKDKDKEKL